MEREGFDPAADRRRHDQTVHTAVKISPNYQRGQAIYVLDASRAVGVVSGLLSPTSERLDGRRQGRDEYKVREAFARGQDEKHRITLARGPRQRLQIDWTSYKPPKPSFLGTRSFEAYDLAELCPLYRLDAVLPAWELPGAIRNPRGRHGRRGGAEAVRGRAGSCCSDHRREVVRRAAAWSASGRRTASATTSRSIADETRKTELARCTRFASRWQPRRHDRANVALADFIAPKETGVADYIGGFAVTAGHRRGRTMPAFKRQRRLFQAIMA